MRDSEQSDLPSGAPVRPAGRQPIGLRTRLALLALAAALPLLALTVILSFRSYHSERAQVEQHTVETAHALALAVDRELAGLKSALVALSLSRELRDGNLPAFHAQAGELKTRLGAINVGVSDMQGRKLLDTAAPFGGPLLSVPVPAGIDAQRMASEPVVSDLVSAPGGPRLSVDMPVRTAIGPVLLSIAVPVQLLNDILVEERLPGGWIISLLDRSGAIVARSHALDAYLGRKAAPALLAALQNAETGTAEFETLDHISVLAAFRRSRVSGWTAVVAIPASDLSAPLRRNLFTIAGVTALLLLAGIALTALLARRIEEPILALVAPALALGRGERVSVPPLHLREAHQLGRAIETAADLLKARERQRDRAEAQLRESEQRFRTMADGAPVMIWMWGADKGGVYFNRVWLDFTGRSLEEELGDGWLDDFHREDGAALDACMKAFEARQPFQIRMRLQRHDGVWRWLLNTGIPRFESDGSFAGYIGSCLDVTDSQAAETALRESEVRLRASEERFRILSQSAMEGVVIHDGERILDANERTATMFGYRLDEVIGRSPFDLVAPSARGESMRRSLGQSTEPYESIGLRKNGTTLPMQFWGRPIRYHGRTARVGVIRDLTEVKQAAAALRHSELRYRTLVDASASIVWSTDAQGYFVSPQPSWEQFTGQKWPEYTAEGWIAVVHPEDREASQKRWPDAVTSQTVYTIEHRLWHAPSGAYRWVSVRAVPIRDADGAVLEWIGTITDIDAGRRTADELRRLNDTLESRVAERTRELAEANERLRAEMLERLRIEEVLSQAQKMEAIGHMTGGVAHDFNNLLTVVVGNLEMIERSPGADDRTRRLAGAALAAAGRGERLTQQLLAFARRQTLHARVLDLNRLIRDFEPLLRRALGEGIELVIELDPEGATCKIDASQFETALLNLIVNARDASSPGNRVVVSSRRERLEGGEAGLPPEAQPDAYIRVTVEDRGGGIAPEIISRVFEPFFTTKEVGKGSGLGLSQVYGFVRQSGGTIRIDSEPGKGTRVNLFLPASADVAAPEELGVREPAMRLEGRSVLVVEDDEAVRHMAVECLRDLGCTVHEAADAGEALRVLKEKGVDLMFSDIVMPRGMNGVALARAARSMRPDLPILLTTGYSGQMSAGLDAFKDSLPLLRKPYRRAELAQKIREALSAAPPRRSTGPLKVLLVEDDPLVRWATLAMFEELGHAVTATATAREALQSLEAERFDVLFTDLGLPDSSGIDLAREALSRVQGLKVVIATGYQESDPGGAQTGSWVRLPKPYHSADLQRVLSTIA
jgi:PAS domain S-box-containing protein